MKTRLPALLMMAAIPAFAAGPPPVLLLDNFDQGKTENVLGGITGAWGDPDDKSQGAVANYDDKVRLGSMGNSLRLDYDIESQRENVYVPSNYSVYNPAVPTNQAFNGYYSLFPPQDVRPYNYLILWAKGDQERGYSRTFKVEIKDGLTQTYKGVIVEGVGLEWRRFVIPLREFTDIKDWTSIKEFVIVFAADTVTRKTGSLYVDEIFFAQSGDNNITLPERSAAAPRADKAPEIDGKLKDWPRRSFLDISKAQFVESGKRDLHDLGVRFGVRWDADWLYLAVDIDDNEIMNPEDGETLWKGDCVEVYISPKGQDFTWGNPAYFQLGFSPTSASGRPGRWAWFQRRAPTEGEVKTSWDKKGKAAEMAIAWKFLGIQPAAGTELGFSLGYHDLDRDDTPEAKLQWSYQNVAEGRARLGKLVLE